MQEKKYRQLVITPSYVPVDSSVTLINAKIIDLLETKNVDSVVLTVAPDDTSYCINKKLLYIFPSSRKVYRIRSYEKGGKWLIAARKFLKIILPFLFYIPDFHFVWEMLAITKLRKITQENKIDLIHSISAPYCSHIVGYFAKLVLKKPWVCHLDDFWADQPVEHFDRYRFLNYWLERICFEKADIVLSTSREILDFASKRYPNEITQKFKFIPPCYNSSEYPKTFEKNSNKHTFTFLGIFYRNHREPYGLFNALDIIKKERSDVYNKISVRLIGRNAGGWDGYIRENGLDDVVILQGQVDYKQSLIEMKKTTVLIHFGFMQNKNETDIHVSGKIFEYFGAQRMILGITTPKGPVADIIKKARGIVADYNDPGNIAKAMVEIVDNHSISQLYNWKNAGDIEDNYGSEAVVAKHRKLLECLIG
jgi:glycosyltransferase involved in cell wall biosynthesis